MPDRVVDFRSDTVTQPTDAMRDAMRDAKVGDDVYGEDPTVNELQAVAAKMVGMEAALFVPTGTMGNEIAIGVHAPRASELITEEQSHIVLYETAGPSVLWGVQIRTLSGVNGVFTPRQVADALRDPADPHEPRTSLVTIENTHNLAGGTVWTPAQTSAIVKVAEENGLRVHVDGARLFNSAVAQDVPAPTLVKGTDSVMFCLSKGLSAPVGSLVCGSETFIAEALRMRKLLGGGMRQAGVLAAAGIVSLTEMVARLKDDHANARRLAAGLAKVPGLEVDPSAVQSNMVFAGVAGARRTARDLEGVLASAGVRTGVYPGERLRFVTHRHITRADVDWTLEQVANVLERPRTVRARAK